MGNNAKTPPKTPAPVEVAPPAGEEGRLLCCNSIQSGFSPLAADFYTILYRRRYTTLDCTGSASHCGKPYQIRQRLIALKHQEKTNKKECHNHKTQMPSDRTAASWLRKKPREKIILPPPPRARERSRPSMPVPRIRQKRATPTSCPSLACTKHKTIYPGIRPLAAWA